MAATHSNGEGMCASLRLKLVPLQVQAVQTPFRNFHVLWAFDEDISTLVQTREKDREASRDVQPHEASDYESLP